MTTYQVLADGRTEWEGKAPNEQAAKEKCMREVGYNPDRPETWPESVSMERFTVEEV